MYYFYYILDIGYPIANSMFLCMYYVLCTGRVVRAPAGWSADQDPSDVPTDYVHVLCHYHYPLCTLPLPTTRYYVLLYYYVLEVGSKVCRLVST